MTDTLIDKVFTYCKENNIRAIVKADKRASGHYGKECIRVGTPLFYIAEDPEKCKLLDEFIEGLHKTCTLHWYQIDQVELMSFPDEVNSAVLIK